MSKVSGKVWEKPEAGLYHAICCDVIYLGWRKRIWKGNASYKKIVRFAFQLEELNSEGKPFLISRSMPESLEKNSTMRPFLSSWRGRPINDQDIQDGVELDDFLGKQAQLNIIHKIMEDGATVAMIDTIVPPGRSAPRLEIRDYKRVRDRLDEEIPDSLRYIDERPGAEPSGKARQHRSDRELDHGDPPF